MAAPKKITLGSGKLYITTYDASAAMPDIATICTDANIIGYIKGGATITYTPSFYEAKDDLGYVSKTVITNEDVILKSGLMTFDADSLKKLTATGRVSTDTTKKLKTLKVGGIGNYDATKYVIVFKHSDTTDGDSYVRIVGSNQAGFELAFATDKETVIDAEFKAQPLDSSGTLVEFIETTE